MRKTWSVHFWRNLFEWDSESLSTLFSLLALRIHSNKEDVVCLVESNYPYSVKSMTNQLVTLDKPLGSADSSVWRIILLPKMECFTWLALQNRITRRDLNSWGYCLPTPSPLIIFVKYFWKPRVIYCCCFQVLANYGVPY